MTLKEQLHNLIDTLADDDSAVEELEYQLYVLTKVRTGLAAIDSGHGVPHDEAVKRLDQWLSK